MGRRGSKTPPACGTLAYADQALFDGNVVPLSAYRARRHPCTAHKIYYVNDDARWLDVLTSLPHLQTTDVSSMEALRDQLLRGCPDLILMESALGWADPVELIAQLHCLVPIPVVLICDRALSGKRGEKFLKRAYAAGAHDTLYAPLQRDELHEALDVLLKLQRHVSL